MKHDFKRLCSFALALCIVFSLIPFHAFAADGDVVATIGTTEYTDLQSALINAADGDTITLLADVDADMSIPTYSGEGVFNISKNITIDGNGNNINATGTGDGHILNIVDANVVISNLTVNGNSAAGVTKTRSGINVVGQNGTANVELNNVTVINTNGSAVTVNSATVTANGLTTENNGWYGVNVHGKYGDAEFILNSGDVTSVVVESSDSMTSAVEINGGEVDALVSGGTVAGTEVVTINGGTITTVGTFDQIIAEYVVTFLVNGEEYATRTVKHGELVTAPADPAVEGYTFGGWDTDLTVGITADITVNAVLTANDYTVSYRDENGGQLGISETWTYGEKVTITQELEDKDNAEFIGWLGNDGSFYEVGRSYTVSYAGNLNLQAVYDYNDTYFLLYFYDVDGSIYETVLMTRELDDEYQITVPEYAPISEAKWKISTGDVWYGAGETVDIAEGTYFTVDLDIEVNEYVVEYNVDGTVTRTESAVDAVYRKVVEFTPVINADEQLLSVTVKGNDTGVTYACNETAVAGTYAFTMPAEAVTVTVSLKAMADVTVTYVVGEGTAPAAETLGWNTTFVAAEYTPAAGEKFICWQASDGRMMLPGQSYVVTENLTLTAVCESPDSPIYIVKFSYADGRLFTLALATEENAYTVTAPAYPDVEGYAENGWKAGGVTYDAGEAITVTADLDLTLVTSVQTYNVIQTANPDLTHYDAILAEYGSTVTVNVKPVADYLFDSITVVGDSGKAYTISAVSEGVQYTFTMPAETVTVTVNYKPVPVESTVINFYVDGVLYDYKVIDQGTTLTEMPAEPATAGAVFAGWTDGTNILTQVEAPKGVSTINLSATWTNENYTVEFVTGTADSIAAETGLVYGDVITLPAAPVNAGHIFVGWVEASTGFIYAENARYTVDGSETFTAKWEVGDCIVRFLDTMNNTVCGYEVVAYDTTATAPAVAPVYPGKTFVHWTDGANTVLPGAATAAITADTDYEAVWEDVVYHISTTMTNGTVTVASTATAGESVSFSVDVDASYVVSGVALKYTNADDIAVTETIEGSSFTMPASDVEIVVTTEKNVFTVQVDDDANSTIGYTGSSAAAGTSVEFTVTANENYVVENVYVQGASGNKIPVTVVVSGSDKTYSFIMPKEDVTIVSTSVKSEHVVTYVGHDNTYLGSETVASGEFADAADIVTGRTGYTFKFWTAIPGTGAEFQLDSTAVTSDLVLKAVYEGVEHDVVAGLSENVVSLFVRDAAKATSGELMNASVTAVPSATGNEVRFTVAAEFNYTITDVAVRGVGTDTAVTPTLFSKVTGSDDLTYYTYVFTMPNEDVQIDVYTEAKEYKVSVVENAPGNGTYTINGDTTTNKMIAQGETVTIDITPAAGYVVDTVVATYDNGSSQEFQPTMTAGGTFTFTMVPYEVVVEITYKAVEYSVDVKQSNAETFKPVLGEVVESLSDDETSKGKVEIEGADVEYAPIAGTTLQYEIPGNLTDAIIGQQIVFTVTEYTGYDLKNVTVTYAGGTKTVTVTENGGKYYFEMPAADVVITATFTEETYKVIKDDADEANGTVTVNALTETAVSVDYKEPVTVKVTPDVGYYVASIGYELADGTVKDFDAASYTGTMTENMVETAHEITFHMPASDVELVVEYGKIDYTITTVYNEDHGSVTTEPAGSAVVGQIVTAIVTPKPGYKLESVTVTYADGKKSCVLTQVSANEFAFTMPAGDVVVTAVFTEVTYIANLVVSGQGLVTLNGYHTDNVDADYLDTVTVNVAPEAGWQLESIVIDNGNVTVNEPIAAEGGDYTFTMPEKDVLVLVKLSKIGYDLKSYAINFYEMGHGTVTLAPADMAYVGDKVGIAADPDDGYRLKEVVVTDADGYAVPVSFVSGDAYHTQVWSFTMPASAVDIVVIFEVDASSYYTDVRTDHWFYKAVTYVTDRGYFLGVTTDLFAPYVNMNRGMFVTVLGRMTGIDTSAYTDQPFADVDADAYYAPYVAWAAENGIVAGRSAEKFDPLGNITREEIVAIMYRYAKYLGIDVTAENQVFMDRYTDTDEISDYAVDAMNWAVGAGILLGRTDSTIDPKDLASRAEVAQIVKNFCDKVIAP